MAEAVSSFAICHAHGVNAKGCCSSVMENDEEVCIGRGRHVGMQHEIIVLWFRITSPTKHASKPLLG